MMSVMCQSLDFGRHVLDYVACGCSSNTPLDPHTVRGHVKLSTKGRKRRHQARTLICSRRKVGQCRVFSTTKPETVLNDITDGPQPFLELRKEESRSPISSTSLFEVVGNDLQKLKQNHLSVSGAELHTILCRFGVSLLAEIAFYGLLLLLLLSN